MPELSIVVPLYNEEDVFPSLFERLKAVVDRLPFDVEVLLVDDGSSDSTGYLIGEAAHGDPRFKGILLSRNFGHQVAVTAGLQYSSGRAVAVIDGDLQDPPELLPALYEKMEQGYDVVYAVRRSRRENLLKRTAYAAFYRLLRLLSETPIPADSGDFAMMSRRVVDCINDLPERHRFIRGMRAWVGFRHTSYPYDRDARSRGRSKYSLARLVRLALDGIFTFSERPLRWSSYTGFAVSLAAALWGGAIVAWRLMAEDPPVGFATLAAGMFFLGGVQLMSIGILGEYIGRIHNEVKGRPLYIVDRTFGIAEARRQIDHEPQASIPMAGIPAAHFVGRGRRKAA